MDQNPKKYSQMSVQEKGYHQKLLRSIWHSARQEGGYCGMRDVQIAWYYADDDGKIKIEEEWWKKTDPPSDRVKAFYSKRILDEEEVEDLHENIAPYHPNPYWYRRRSE